MTVEAGVNALTRPVVLIRGAGELASGVGWALAKAGFRVLLTEVEQPLMVRWPVCFGTAVEEGKWQVEELAAYHVKSPEECPSVWAKGEIPILVDPELKTLNRIQPLVLVDAIMAKRNIGTLLDMAPLTVGLGPGFTAGQDVHLVIETNRGHDLGRILTSGSAEPNTGVPGNIAGYSRERVVYSSQAGIFCAEREIGESVNVGDVLGYISSVEELDRRENGQEHAEVRVGGEARETIRSPLNGVLRGLLRSGTRVGAHVKIGDVDPRGQVDYCWTLSEKARAIGTAVLLSILSQCESCLN